MRLIDADELKKKAYPFPCAIGIEHAVTIRGIDDAPTVEPIKQGSIVWFNRKNGYPIDGYDYDWGWMCSVCGYEYPPDDTDHPDDPLTNNFCSNCGAYMGTKKGVAND